MADLVLERRLRPVMEMIDHRNFKAALKAVSTISQKHPANVHVKLLKALVLERLGRAEESLQVCREVKVVKPLEEKALQDLHQQLLRLGHGEEVLECYEAAAALSPGSLPAGEALFLAYVRSDKPVQQQLCALKLYKRSGQERHLLWAVCSLLLQLPATTKLVELAEGLLARHWVRRKVESAEALRVHLDVLHRLGKHQEQREVVEGVAGELLTIPAERLRMRADYHLALGERPAAAALYREVLALVPDDWAVMVGYLDAALPGAEVAEVVGGVGGGEGQRGRSLALLDLAARQGEGLAEALLHHFTRFAHTYSFATDVGPYLPLLALPHPGARQLSDDCQTLCNNDPHPHQLRHLRLQVSHLLLQEQLGLLCHLSDAALVERSGRLCHLYLSSLPWVGAREGRERGGSEELLCLAADGLLEVYRRGGEVGHLVAALHLLERGRKDRPLYPPYVLHLTSLYGLLGAASKAVEMFSVLGVKHVQLATLLHHILPSLLLLPPSPLLQAAHHFFEHAGEEGGAATVAAFSHETYTKALEFTEFLRSLEGSHLWLLLRAERQVAVVMEGAATPPALLAASEFGRIAVAASLQPLHFTEDWSGRPWWTPSPHHCHLPPTATPTAAAREWGRRASRSEAEGAAASSLRARCLLLRCVTLAVQADAREEEGAQQLAHLLPGLEGCAEVAVEVAVLRSALLWQQAMAGEEEAACALPPTFERLSQTMRAEFAEGVERAFGCAEGASLVPLQLAQRLVSGSVCLALCLEQWAREWRQHRAGRGRKGEVGAVGEGLEALMERTREWWEEVVATLTRPLEMAADSLQQMAVEAVSGSAGWEGEVVEAMMGREAVDSMAQSQQQTCAHVCTRLTRAIHRVRAARGTPKALW